MSDDSNHNADEDAKTTPFKREDVQSEAGIDGTMELDPSSIEVIEDANIEPISEDEPDDESGHPPAPKPDDDAPEPGESTQVMERDRLARHAEQDRTEETDLRGTAEMKPVEDSTTAYEIPTSF